MIGSRRNAGLLLFAALGGGCFYSFNNPVQQKPNGSISGQVQLQNAGAQTTADGGVEVLFSGGLALRLDSSGDFSFLALPDGTYSLGIYIPPLASNDFPLLARLTGVVLPGNAGAVDAVNLGAVLLQPSGLVTGSVTDTLGPATAVVAAFAPGPDGGLGTYEAFSVATDGGNYAFYLPAGNHILAASNASLSTVGAPVTLQAKQTQSLDFFLDAGGTVGIGNVQGSLVFGGPDAGASMLPADIDLSSIQFTATDPRGNMTMGSVFPSGTAFNPGLGAPFFLALPAGQPLDIRFVLPAQQSDAGANTFDPLLLAAIPALESQTTYLGQVTWLPVATFQANAPDAGGSGGTTGGTSGSTTGGNSTGAATSGGSGTTSGGGTTGTTTGGTSGSTTTGGTTGPLSSWSLVGSLNLPGSDAGPANIYAVVPIPLPNGGHRLVWGTNQDAYYADSQGTFGAPTAFPIDSGVPFPVFNLSGAPADGGSVIAWTTAGAGLQVAFVPDQGGTPQPLTLPVPVPLFFAYQGTSTFAGRQGGLDGTFVISPDPTLGGLLVLFTSDNTTFTQQTVNLDLGGTVFLNTVIGSACQTSDITSGSGLCFAGSGAIGNASDMDAGVVVAGTIDTSGAAPALVNRQLVLNLPSPSLATTVALGVIVGDGGLPDTVVVSAGVTIPPIWTSFSSLAAAPTVQLVTGGYSFAPILPWAGQAVGFSLVNVPPGIDAAFVESGAGATPVLPNVLGSYPSSNVGFPNGYVDATTGRPIIAGCSTNGGILSIWQLPPSPGADAGP